MAFEKHPPPVTWSASPSRVRFRFAEGLAVLDWCPVHKGCFPFAEKKADALKEPRLLPLHKVQGFGSLGRDDKFDFEEISSIPSRLLQGLCEGTELERANSIQGELSRILDLGAPFAIIRRGA